MSVTRVLRTLVASERFGLGTSIHGGPAKSIWFFIVVVGAFSYLTFLHLYLTWVFSMGDHLFLDLIMTLVLVLVLVLINWQELMLWIMK